MRVEECSQFGLNGYVLSTVLRANLRLLVSRSIETVCGYVFNVMIEGNAQLLTWEDIAKKMHKNLYRVFLA